VGEQNVPRRLKTDPNGEKWAGKTNGSVVQFTRPREKREYRNWNRSGQIHKGGKIQTNPCPSSSKKMKILIDERREKEIQPFFHLGKSWKGKKAIEKEIGRVERSIRLFAIKKGGEGRKEKANGPRRNKVKRKDGYRS